MTLKKIGGLLIICAFVVLIFSCGNEPPNISFPSYNILIYQSKSFNNPTDNIFLSLYFVLYDDDGFEDISKVKITHLKSEYSWNINPAELTKYDHNNRTYYGFSFIEYDNGKSILLGDYGIEVEDKAGNLFNTMVAVEIEGADNEVPYNVPEIKYEISAADKGRELKIENGEYWSAEVKALNRADLFGGERKKFKNDEKIMINDKKNILPQGTPLSVRINKDVNETMIYYLSVFSLSY